ncbi:MAG: recombinase family protein [Oscillospiraceae bacterium]|nr:recombinase family protein [Oscillospiraceae bacterium]
MLPKQTNYSVGIYMRLSRDDERAGESLSIENQRAILTEYVSKQGWTVYDEYIDDGVSGVSFDRPGVQRLLDDAKTGKINLILCKDLSRFGRNYIQVGQFTDYIFPMHNIRFIALADNVDTANSCSTGMDMMPIVNIFNEWHCASTSKKIRAVLEADAKKGKYKSPTASYGYVKSDDEKHTPVIDPEAAAVVRRIFELRAKGITMSHIAEILNAEKIPSPSEYYYGKIDKPNRKSVTNLWCRTSVRRILKNPIYIGTMAQLRTTTVSYKNHKVIRKNKEDWIVVEQNHEPIISQELWDKVRELDDSVSKGKRDSSGNIALFSGMLYCQDCGYKMKKIWLNRKNGDIGYSCGYRARFGKEFCSTHTIRESALAALVIADIQSKLRIIIDEDKARKQFLEKKSGVRSSQTASDAKRKREIEHRLAELDTLTQSVYENMVLGKVPEEVCVKLIEKYLEENKTLQTEAEAVQERLDTVNQDEQDVDEFIRRLKKYAGVEVLTREMLIELVEYITVEEAPENRNTPRKVHIYYKFLDKAISNKHNVKF